MDEDSLHRRSLEQEPIHSLNEPGAEEEQEPKVAEVVVKNPLVALKAISKDFKAASASEEVRLLLLLLLFLLFLLFFIIIIINNY
jgi:hypothetical protein